MVSWADNLVTALSEEAFVASAGGGRGLNNGSREDSVRQKFVAATDRETPVKALNQGRCRGRGDLTHAMTRRDSHGEEGISVAAAWQGDSHLYFRLELSDQLLQMN